MENKLIKPICIIPHISVGEIPTGFEDSLSYFEILKRITKKLNEVIDVFNALATQTMIEYIDNYIKEHYNEMMYKMVYNENEKKLILYIQNEEE